MSLNEPRDLAAEAALASVSVVVLSYNRKEELERNLPALVSMAEDRGLQLIVVDNASTDGSGDFVKALLQGRRNCMAVANPSNEGVAGGRNSGWKLADREFLLNIDDDTIVTGQAIAAMALMMRANPNWGALSPRILHAQTGAGQLDLGSKERRIANFHGACHLVRRDMLGDVGLNDEACAFGGEEIDLSIRIRAAGFDVVYVPEVTALHNSRVRQGPEGIDRRIRWLYNFVRVYHKHFPRAFATSLALRYSVSHLVSGIRLLGPRAIAPLVRAALSGRRDGIRQHRAVPSDVVSFYRDPRLQPEFGNVPLLLKLARRFGARAGEQAA